MKKKEILLIISIFLVVLILFSSSYALLFKSDQTDKQSYATGVLSITSEATNNSVTLNNALPMSDTDGASSTPYTFKITNTGNLSYKFNVMLLSTTTENQISAEYIKVKVNDNAPVKLNSLTNGVILSDITLKPEAFVEISLRVWLDESTPNTEIGKSFNAKITTEGEAVYVSGDKSDANSPDLVQGLIPVVYNTASSKWVKADTTVTTQHATCNMLGDVNGDGTIDTLDVTRAQRFIGGTTTPTAEQFLCTDLNADGVITTEDLQLILSGTGTKVAAGIIGESVSGDVMGTNQWYDYNLKKWANAVLVSDTGIDYPITSKSVSISNGAGNGVYSNTNQKKKSTTSSTTFTITTGSTAGTISFNYTVSSESNYDKLIVTLNGTEKLNKSGNLTTATAFSMNVSANTTYTMIIKYTKDGSGDNGTDTATISNLTFPTGATVTITPDATYPFGEQLNQKIGSKFTYDTSTNQYTISDTVSTAISSSTVGKYICPDISQTSCSTMYKVTESNTKITKVEEYGVPSTRSGIRSTYTNASEGTEIREDDILAFYVWIPRYKYRVWNISKQAGAESTYAYNAKTEGIDIVFESGKESTGTISCTYNYNVDSANGGVDLSTTTAETCTGSNGDYYTHPAFTFGSDNVKGFWISKFEISSSNPTTTDGGGNVTNLTVRSLPNVTSWRNNAVSNFSTVIQNMQTSSNIYGLSTSRTNTDSHMLTNYEWGAVAYLTNSKYGRCTEGSCTEVTINNCQSYVTGIGANSISAGWSSTTCTTAANKYDGTYGKLASTTGNITGVYDMSGGSYEYVMGNISKVTTGYTFYPSSSSFSSSWYTTDTAKYLTTYAYDSSNQTNQTAYNRGRLGDATAETLLSASTSGEWYSDFAYFPYSSYAWFGRSGHYGDGTDAGVFCFSNDDFYGSMFSSRAALVSLGA